MNQSRGNCLYSSLEIVVDYRTVRLSSKGMREIVNNRIPVIEERQTWSERGHWKGFRELRFSLFLLIFLVMERAPRTEFGGHWKSQNSLSFSTFKGMLLEKVVPSAAFVPCPGQSALGSIQNQDTLIAEEITVAEGLRLVPLIPCNYVASETASHASRPRTNHFVLTSLKIWIFLRASCWILMSYEFFKEAHKLESGKNFKASSESVTTALQIEISNSDH